MAELQRQHYVPRFYLQHFCNADGKLWGYSKSRGGCFAAAPENIAHERYYYSPEINGVRLHDIEKQFSQCEGQAQPIHQKLVTMGLPLTGEEKDIYADFMALCYARTPGMRRVYAELEGHLERLIWQNRPLTLCGG